MSSAGTSVAILTLGASEATTGFFSEPKFAETEQALFELFGAACEIVAAVRRFDECGNADDVRESIRLLGNAIADGESERGRVEEVIVLIVGHGDLAPDGDLRIALKDSTEGNALHGTFCLRDIASALAEACGQRRVHLLVDTCHAAAITAHYEASQHGPWTFLCACAADEEALCPEEGYLTRFGEAVASVLEHGSYPNRLPVGSPQSTRALSEAVSAWYRERSDSRAISVGAFGVAPGAGEITPLPDSTSLDRQWLIIPASNSLSWAVVISSNDAAIPAHLRLERLAYDIWQLRADLALPPGFGEMTERASLLHANAIASDDGRFLSAVRVIANADLCIFDLTGYQPVVMLLLGIRSCVARGVTLCTVHESLWSQHLAQQPFHAKEVQLLRHGYEGHDRHFIDHTNAATKELDEASWLYQDLPSFVHVRSMPPLPESRHTRPWTEAALVMCPFSDIHRTRFWPQIRPAINNTLRDLGASTTLSVQRTVDIVSTRLVSSALFEAIRLTDLVVVDVSQWRPSVLFELGVALAVSRFPPLVIGCDDVEMLPDSFAVAAFPASNERQEGAFMGLLEQQCNPLLQLTRAITYDSINLRDSLEAATRQWVVAVNDYGKFAFGEDGTAADLEAPAFRKLSHQPHRRIKRQQELRQLIWSYMRLDHEPEMVDVFRYLVYGTSVLDPPEAKLEESVHFPPDHRAWGALEPVNDQRRLVAWLLLSLFEGGQQVMSSTDHYRRRMYMAGWAVASGMVKHAAAEEVDINEVFVGLKQMVEHSQQFTLLSREV